MHRSNIWFSRRLASVFVAHSQTFAQVPNPSNAFKQTTFLETSLGLRESFLKMYVLKIPAYGFLYAPIRPEWIG